MSVSAEQRDLHARVVEAGAAAEIGQRVGHERVRGRSVVRASAPQALRQRDGAGPDVGVERDRAVDFAELVEDADRIVRRESARGARRPGASAARPARSRSSPSVEEIVFSLAGEISASGYARSRVRLIAVEAGRRVAISAAGNRSIFRSGVSGKTSTNWTGAPPNGGVADAALPSARLPSCRRQPRR